MFNFGSDRRGPLVGMETSAMTDIVFLLLIFFLLSSSFILRTEIPVTVPKSDSTISQKDDPVVVTVNRKGDIYVDQEKVTREDLPTALGTRLAGKAVKAVVIRGDKAVELGDVVSIMDAVRGVGAERIAIATEQK